MNIIKSPNDKNDYHTFELDNKLQVFLEHNPKIQISCVMVIVKIGYMIDKFNGMAHFLEHMLFNGTRKYPEEKFFSEFITKNGGHTNAFTTHNHTCYYYTIDTNALEKSLEIFSHFFVSPLFKKDTVAREREAVNSEHEKNLNDDDWRFQNVLKQVCNINNPYRKFSTGSNKTLDVPNIDKEIRELFDLYYSSDLMTLCVVTNNAIETTSGIIKSNFDKITIKPKPHLPKNNTPIFDSPKSIYVVPVADISKISLSWEIPAFKQNRHKNPINFISYLIGHEGKHTLYNFLIELGYILSLHCQIYEEVGNSSIFFIDITLSEIGEQHTTDVINMVFKYIKLIQTLFERSDKHLSELYKEQQMLNNYFFQFTEQIDPEKKCMQYYETLSSCDIPLKYLLIINYLNDDFDNIKDNALCILNELVEQKCIVAYTSKKNNKIAKTIDEHYGTHYSISNKKIIVGECNSNLMLPTLNKYMSFGKNLISETDSIPIKNDNGYLFRTTEFENPNVNINLKIYLPTTLINKHEYTQTIIYFASIMLNIGHELYMCETAGYDVDMMFDMGKLNIEIQGNYKKILNVCEFLVSSLINPQFTKDEFERTLYSFKQNDINLSFEAPYTRVANYFNKNTLLKFYTNLDRLSCYKNLTYENTKHVANTILKLGTMDLLISGNCDKKLYSQLENTICKLRPRVEYRSNKILDDMILKYDKKINIINVSKENPDEKNNSVGTYLHIATIKNLQNDIIYKCALDVVQKFISQEYFFQLRTQEKFGYIVGSGIVLISNYKTGNLYFRFIVQSPKKTPDEMIKRTLKFIKEFSKHINNIKEEEFDKIISACIMTEKEPSTNLNDLANEKMMELHYGLTTFDSKNKMIDCYKRLKLDDIKHFYMEKFYSNKKLFVHV